jgi:hypothetical protein
VGTHGNIIGSQRCKYILDKYGTGFDREVNSVLKGVLFLFLIELIFDCCFRAASNSYCNLLFVTLLAAHVLGKVHVI